jgi:uridine kinase
MEGLMIEQLEKFLLNNPFNIIGISGNSGAGKTTLTKALAKNPTFCQYSFDYRLIGDSKYRQELLLVKAFKSLESYIDMCNESNWWDWDLINKDLESFLYTKTITTETAYNRDTGLYEKKLKLTGNKLLADSAIFGTPAILEKLDIIVFVYQKQEVRLNRSINKDLGRRSLHDILARFFITEYSESLHYRFLLENYKEKLFIVDENYNQINLRDDIFAPPADYLPIRIGL